MDRSRSRQNSERLWFLALLAGLFLGAWLRGETPADQSSIPANPNLSGASLMTENQDVRPHLKIRFES